MYVYTCMCMLISNKKDNFAHQQRVLISGQNNT